MTPSDSDAVAEAKCLLLRPLLVGTGSSIGWNSNVYDGFHCSALAALVVNVMLSAVGLDCLISQELSAVLVAAKESSLRSLLLTTPRRLAPLAAIKYLSALLSSPCAQR